MEDYHALGKKMLIVWIALVEWDWKRRILHNSRVELK